MLEIQMPKDIKDFEPKIIGPFTMRQIVCLMIALAYGLPIIFLINGDIIVRILIGMIAMMPMILCGWLKVFDEPFEKFLKIIIVNKFLKPVKRKYKIKGTYETEEKHFKKIKRSKTEKGWK